MKTKSNASETNEKVESPEKNPFEIAAAKPEKSEDIVKPVPKQELPTIESAVSESEDDKSI